MTARWCSHCGTHHLHGQHVAARPSADTDTLRARIEALADEHERARMTIDPVLLRAALNADR